MEIANPPALEENEPNRFLADANGDGLTDLMVVRSGWVDVWPLLPGDRFGAKYTVSGTPVWDSVDTAIRLADMNGNGSTDIVWSQPGAQPGEERFVYLDLVGEVRPNLLTAVENGLGKRLEVKYTTSGTEYQRAREAAGRGEGQGWATRVPFPVQVIAESAVSDGLGHRHVTSYRYRDGWYAKDTREFRGFALVARTEQGDASDATAVQVHEFDLGQEAECRKGSLLSLEQQTEAGALLMRDRYEYAHPPYGNGELAWAPRINHETEHLEGGNSPVTTREQWEYDNFGNVTKHREWGIVQGDDVLSGHDERITASEFANDTASWLLGRATRTAVTDAAGMVLSDVRTYYDGEPFVGLPYGQVGAAGAPTRTESWVSGDHWAQTERVQRDEYGLVTMTLDPLGARREIDYDPETHSFPVAERAFYGERVLTFSADYDLALGVLRTYRDAAGAETRFTWDPLLHLIAIAKPGDSEAEPTTSFQYLYGNPTSQVVVKSRVRSGANEFLERHLHYDGLGRQLAAVEQAEGGRTLVTGAKTFGALGRVVAEYEPFFSQGYDLPAPAGPLTSHTYDALGRRRRSALPDGSTSELRYAPFTVERWDAEDLDPASPHAGTQSIERSTAVGVAEVVEDLAGKKLSSLFDRDALGRIAVVTDAIGAVSRWQRDGLGRVALTDHADAGKTEFTYDDAGNLLERVDARGARVITRYDELSRPSQERLLDPGGAEEEKVVYHYDDPSPLFPGDIAVGELAWVEDGAGEEHYRRDERGRLVEFARKVDGKEYRVRHAHDDLDRMTKVTFPGGRTIDLEYNERGLLESVPGVISSIEYSAQGLATRREHANGSVSTASYDEMDRVSSLETETGGRKVQAASYRYDRVGNLLTIDDALRSAGPLAAGRGYAYDDLYRIVSGTGAGRSWSYSFDAAGDFSEKGGAAHVLGRAHQIASAGGKAYGHDAAGNVVERPGSRQSYDAKGRLRSVTLDGGTVVSYRYDYTGQRVVKETRGPRGAHRTVYVDRMSEERYGKQVDYVFAGDVRVARLGGDRPVPVAPAGLIGGLPAGLASSALVLLAMAAAAAMAEVLRRRARGLVALGTACAFLSVSVVGCGRSGGAAGMAGPAAVYHGDHLGGVALQTDESGAVAAEVAYDPYGAQLAGSTEPYAFTGKELDVETGLYDFGARAYDPALGRFLSPDPAALADPELGVSDPQFLNPYAYGRNSPTGHVDPDGKLPHILVGALVGAGVGGGIYLVKAAITGQFSWRGLGGATAGGAVAGAVAAATCGASLVVQGAAAGLAGGIAQRGVETASLSKTLDPRAMAVDGALGAAAGPVAKLAGRSLAAVGQRVAPVVKKGLASLKQVAGSANPFQRVPWTYGQLAPRVLGATNKWGDITIRNGLVGPVLNETVRHEAAHRWLSPLLGQRSGLRELRANAVQWGYSKSHLLRFLEEGLAQTVGTGNPARGFQFAYQNYDISAGRLLLEGAGYVGAAGGGMYLGYKAGERVAENH